MTDLSSIFTMDTGEPESKCIGQMYRASVGIYKTSTGIGQTICLNLLKRRSCTGCDECNRFITESIIEDGYLHGLEKLENGDLCRLEYFDIHTDWETGIVDDWSVRVVRVVDND